MPAPSAPMVSRKTATTVTVNAEHANNEDDPLNERVVVRQNANRSVNAAPMGRQAFTRPPPVPRPERLHPYHKESEVVQVQKRRLIDGLERMCDWRVFRLMPRGYIPDAYDDTPINSRSMRLCSRLDWSKQFFNDLKQAVQAGRRRQERLLPMRRAVEKRRALEKRHAAEKRRSGNRKGGIREGPDELTAQDLREVARMLRGGN